MILQVDTNNGTRFFTITGSFEAVDILRRLTRAGFTCYRWEVIKCS